jgi:hypothetical protein
METVEVLELDTELVVVEDAVEDLLSRPDVV